MTEQLGIVQEVYSLIVNFAVTYSFQLLGAVIVLAVGFVVGGWLSRILLGVMERRDVDVTLRQLLASTARMVIVGIFLVIALSQMGVSITPLIAAIGGLAVGVSFALQGPVSNYGAGLAIILTRMFRVNDTITVCGCSGIVKEITLATTILESEDGERIVIPNKEIAGQIHRNSFENRIVEAQVGIAYGADPEQAISVIEEALGNIDDVSTEPGPVVGINSFGDSSIILDYRFWVPSERYFTTMHAANLAVFRTLRDNGIEIPFPQREIRMLQA